MLAADMACCPRTWPSIGWSSCPFHYLCKAFWDLDSLFMFRDPPFLSLLFSLLPGLASLLLPWRALSGLRMSCDDRTLRGILLVDAAWRITKACEGDGSSGWIIYGPWFLGLATRRGPWGCFYFWRLLPALEYFVYFCTPDCCWTHTVLIWSCACLCSWFA